MIRSFGARALRILREITRERPAPARTPAVSRRDMAGAVRRPREARATTVLDGADELAGVTYEPQPGDGAADPGEVCWTWVPYEEDPSIGKDRPVLVLARRGAGFVVAQMTSKDHRRDAAQERRAGREWCDVGAGAWDAKGRPSEVRLDRLLYVERQAIRREGASLAPDRFAAVIERMRRTRARGSRA